MIASEITLRARQARRREEAFLSMGEVASQLGLCVRSIERYIERGDLDAIKIGKAKNAPVRIQQLEVDRFKFGGRRCDFPGCLALATDEHTTPTGDVIHTCARHNKELSDARD